MASFGIPLMRAQGWAPRSTATAGTVFTFQVPPHPAASSWFTRLLSLAYTIGTTAHALTCLREKSRTTCPLGAAAGQKVIVLAADPGLKFQGPNGTQSQIADRGIAANDYIAWQYADGTVGSDIVASVSGLAVTITTANLAIAIPAGAIIWYYGLATDQNPLDEQALVHPIFEIAAAASATTQQTLGGIQTESIGGLVRSTRPFSPLLLLSNNLTTAGFIEHVTAGYTDR
jgi:hypothetical protein